MDSLRSPGLSEYGRSQLKSNASPKTVEHCLLRDAFLKHFPRRRIVPFNAKPE